MYSNISNNGKQANIFKNRKKKRRKYKKKEEKIKWM